MEYVLKVEPIKRKMHQVMLHIARSVQTKHHLQALKLVSKLSRNLQVESIRLYTQGINGSRGNNDELSPYERLLQHSKQFRDGDLDLDEEFDEDESDDSDPTANQIEDVPVDDNLTELADEYSSWTSLSSKGYKQTEKATRQIKRHTSLHPSIRMRIDEQINESEKVDFEHGLSRLDEHRRRKMQYTQLLMRDERDQNRVCHNCGERGHMTRNCPLPRICSKCGSLGHHATDCHVKPMTPDQLVRTRNEQEARQRHDKAEQLRLQVERIERQDELRRARRERKKLERVLRANGENDEEVTIQVEQLMREQKQSLKLRSKKDVQSPRIPLLHTLDEEIEDYMSRYPSRKKKTRQEDDELV